MTGVFLAAAILFEVAGTMALRLSEGFTRKRWILPSAAGYVVAFVLLTLVLQGGVPIGVAYGIWTAAGVALTAVLGRLLFQEPLTRVVIGGIVAIIVGVLMLELSAA